MTGNSAVAIALGLALTATAAADLSADAVTLRATMVGDRTPAQSLRIELFRWSTEAERAPVLAAAAEPTPPPAAASAAAAAAPAGRGGRGGGGRGRGGGANAPLSPTARLNAAVKAAPTVGFIWGDGVTGYSIKYAWRAAQPGGGERIVLVTDRRLGAHSVSSPTAAPASARGGTPAPAADPLTEAEFTVIEMHVDGTGAGEGKTSLTSRVAVDAAAQTVTLDAFATAPVLLKVMR